MFVSYYILIDKPVFSADFSNNAVLSIIYNCL